MRISFKLMREEKGQGGKAKPAATKISSLKSMVWTRERNV
jgi:hypothetical protein